MLLIILLPEKPRCCLSGQCVGCTFFTHHEVSADEQLRLCFKRYAPLLLDPRLVSIRLSQRQPSNFAVPFICSERRTEAQRFLQHARSHRKKGNGRARGLRLPIWAIRGRYMYVTARYWVALSPTLWNSRNDVQLLIKNRMIVPYVSVGRDVRQVRTKRLFIMTMCQEPAS